jgi:hypothetical protein
VFSRNHKTFHQQAHCVQDPNQAQMAELNTSLAAGLSQQTPVTAPQTSRNQVQDAPEASQVPRKQGVTDGVWDNKDTEAMLEAQKDKQTSKSAGPPLPAHHKRFRPYNRAYSHSSGPCFA